MFKQSIYFKFWALGLGYIDKLLSEFLRHVYIGQFFRHEIDLDHVLRKLRSVDVVAHRAFARANTSK